MSRRGLGLLRRAALPLLVVVVCAVIAVYFVNHPGGAMGSRILQYPAILKKLRQHVLLVLVSAALAIAVAVPAGILITRPRFRRLSSLIVNTANVGQAVPSIAVLGLFMGLLGIGYPAAVFALWLVSLLPILRNTYAGIDSVDPAVIEAARGMGMRPAQILRRMELPLAMPVIMAGVRTATVINVGTAALATFIGGGGLGDLIAIGISVQRMPITFTGGVLAAGLAIVTDYLLGILEQHLAPRLSGPPAAA